MILYFLFTLVESISKSKAIAESLDMLLDGDRQYSQSHAPLIKAVPVINKSLFFMV
ncbi:MAG: hypothetical protein ACK6BN_13770 [Pseudanabaena sp.]|uniref:hypothetical protein n=1 Tax=Pseudanabaena mucicola TaxID=71190 RepID=UPI0025760FE6|nr:hypothetical protein [Pseudanabaena mucicola]